MDLQSFICNAMEYCNPLTYNLTEELKKSQSEIEQRYNPADRQATAFEKADKYTQKIKYTPSVKSSG